MATDLAWKQRLLCARNGKPMATVMNAITILENDDKWDGVLAYNSFADRVVVLQTPPWHVWDRPHKDLTPPKGAPWRDVDTTRTASYLARHYELVLSHDLVREAVRIVSEKQPIHPIRDFLTSLVWDGRARIDDWLIRIAYVDDTPYARAVMAKWLISAVARGMQPGEKVDHVLILEGMQRSGKSTLFRTLTGNDDWYLETGIELGSKDAYQLIRRKWIVELAELDSMSRAEVSKIKAFITAKMDSYRRAYGREDEDQPRPCVFAGTTNEREYLRDDTGGGRFWSLWSNASVFRQIDYAALVLERDQLWAEAYARWKAGEKWHLTDSKVIAQAIDEQETRRVKDPWEEHIRLYLLGGNRKIVGVTTHDIMADVFELPRAQIGRREEMRVATILRVLGWSNPVQRNGQELSRKWLPTSVQTNTIEKTSHKIVTDSRPKK